MVAFPTTVEEFLSPSNRFKNIYLEGEKEFNHLYVRKGQKYIYLPAGEFRLFPDVFQIARVEAVKPCTGALRRLVERVDRFSGSTLPIYVENLFNPEAVVGLTKSSLGFVRVDVTDSPAPCFLLIRP